MFEMLWYVSVLVLILGLVLALPLPILIPALRSYLLERWSSVRSQGIQIVCLVLCYFVGLGYLHQNWEGSGYSSVDLVNQWIMGRMIRLGRGPQLFLGGPIEEVLRDGTDIPGEASRALGKYVYFDGQIREVAGPPFPPTGALFLAPFAVETWRGMYQLLQVVSLGCALAGGWLLWLGSRGRIGYGVATLVLLLFPGAFICQAWGQNAMLSMLILVAGWACWARGYPFLAGAIWGLFAFKHVFALALIWVPLVLRPRPGRLLAGFLLSGLTFCLATFPFLQNEQGILGGHPIEVWKRWWENGKTYVQGYRASPNWIWVSRDLRGLPRRRMWDTELLTAHVQYLFHARPILLEDRPGSMPRPMFQLHDGSTISTRAIYSDDEGLYFGLPHNPEVLGFALLAIVFGSTVLGSWYINGRPGRAGVFESVGPRSAFAFFGAALTTFHFMVYDLMFFALPTILLYAKFLEYSWTRKVVLGIAAAILALCSADLVDHPRTLRLPIETFMMLFLWACSGYFAWHDVSKGRYVPPY